MVEQARRALAEFLAVPLAVLAGFIALAAGAIALDRRESPWLGDLRGWMNGLVFTSPDATASLLGHLAAGLITVTSITLSLLLIAVQQASSSLTHTVIDQFLRRRVNQSVFGFFVGLSLYTLAVLATVSPSFNPVLSATVALLLAFLALASLLVLVYVTIDQMRPTEVVRSITTGRSKRAAAS